MRIYLAVKHLEPSPHGKPGRHPSGIPEIRPVARALPTQGIPFIDTHLYAHYHRSLP